MKESKLPTGAGPRAADSEERNRARERLIESRARRLGIDLAAAEAQLNAERKTWGAAGAGSDENASKLNAEEEDLDDVQFPTANCLDPHEVEDAVAGDLDSERQDHAVNCPYCRSLLHLAGSADAKVDEFLSEVRATCAAAGIDSTDLRRDDELVMESVDTKRGERQPKNSRRAIPARSMVKFGATFLSGAAASLLIASIALRSSLLGPGASGLPDPGNRLTITSDGKWTQDKIDRLGAVLTSGKVDPSEKLKMISVSLDHRRMAILKNDGDLILWSPSETKRFPGWDAAKGDGALVHFAEDGKLIVSAAADATANPNPVSATGAGPDLNQ